MQCAPRQFFRRRFVKCLSVDYVDMPPGSEKSFPLSLLLTASHNDMRAFSTCFQSRISSRLAQSFSLPAISLPHGFMDTVQYRPLFVAPCRGDERCARGVRRDSVEGDFRRNQLDGGNHQIGIVLYVLKRYIFGMRASQLLAFYEVKHMEFEPEYFFRTVIFYGFQHLGRAFSWQS